MRRVVWAAIALLVDASVIAVALVLLVISVASVSDDAWWLVNVLFSVAIIVIVGGDIPDDIDRFTWALLMKRGSR